VRTNVKLRCGYCREPRARERYSVDGMLLCATCYFMEDTTEAYIPTVVRGVRLTRRGEWLMYGVGTLVFILALALGSF
jgi:hypothetical protein